MGTDAEILMVTPSWESKGCMVCRGQWEAGTPPPELVVSQERRATLHRCTVCGAFWEQFERYADVISSEDIYRYYDKLFLQRDVE